MKNFTMISECIQAFLSENEINSILNDLGYVDLARKFNVFDLLNYWIASSVDGWKSFRDSELKSKACFDKHVDFTTFSKKAKDVPFEFFKRAFVVILEKLNRKTRRSLSIPKKIVAVDSTTITFGESKLPWAKYHGEKSGIKLHVHLDVATFVPVKVLETEGLIHDNAVFKTDLFENTILVKDRAYTDFKTFDRYKNSNQDFVIRIRNNSKFINKKSLQRLEATNSSVEKDFTAVLGNQQSHSTERHRVVFFRDYENTEVRICTNLMNTSAESIAEIYKSRWEIEVFFKWIKQNLNIKRVFGTTKNAVYGQLYSGLIAYLILRILYNFSSQRVRIFKYSFIEFFRNLLFEELASEWVCLIYEFLKSMRQIQTIRC